MLRPSVVAEVRRLLAEGRQSQRQVARQLGISRSLVNRIALGRRRDRPDRAHQRDWPFFNPGPPERCPGCGGRVRMPCLACRIRANREAGAWQEPCSSDDTTRAKEDTARESRE